jgi:magnesium-protoporphyrin O-methyltransferase
MQTGSYLSRRSALETYFDRTAVDAWAKLTTNAPVGSIRATVRAGRDEMRATILSWLPADLHGASVLDAGCGTGLLAVDCAMRGGAVTAVDLSPTLLELARERAPSGAMPGSIDFRAGDMLEPPGGPFDHTVAMDSLIHYQTRDAVNAIAALASRTKRSLIITFAPRTPLLAVMHATGRLFPRKDRAPAIEPVRVASLMDLIADHPRLQGWEIGRTLRVKRGFYISQALELRHA